MAGETDHSEPTTAAGRAYKPEDRSMLGAPPWKPTDPDLIEWEEAHGHDVRLDCDIYTPCHIEIAELQRKAEARQPDSEALRLLRKVVTEYLAVDDGPDGKGCGWCGLNEGEYEHAPTCLVIKARAALAALPPSDSTALDVDRHVGHFLGILPGGTLVCDTCEQDHEHQWVNPANEVVQDNGYRVCAVCGALQPPLSAQPEAQPAEGTDAVER